MSIKTKWRTLLLLSLAVLLAMAVWFSASAVVPTLTAVWHLTEPERAAWVGWERAFAFLAIGPAAGIWAMSALQRSPAVARLASGRG